MEPIYPAGPVGVPEEFAKPGPSYRRRTWIALAGLALFMVFYLLLAGWFALTAWHLMNGALHASRDGFWQFVAGLGAAFFALFMFKGLFLGKQDKPQHDLEVTAAEQPQLFAFLHRLADEAGAPRPHRVFLSPRVNAAVFYELSVLNLFYPSKKNLEIGLGLVNVLSLGEFKAVCAHEFGHFAQRSMAVGRWVYTAQQIAAKIVNRRDALDGFLDGLSRVDIRLAWLGWIMKTIVWSIRAVVDLLFKGVVLAQRALSREMEMQADLVAVSLTGSDTLVHALHRLGAADDAWARAMQFCAAQARDKHIVGDVFAVQSRVIEHVAQILGDPLYGKSPLLPLDNPAAHRIFTADFALPPTMWSTHPLNFERENNAKRHYLPSVADERSAWSLFEQPEALRRQVSLQLAGETEHEAAPLEESLARLETQYAREYFNRAYRGIYLGRAVTLQATRPEGLYDETLQAQAADLDQLYPESLSQDLERLRNLEKEVALLESLRDKTFVPTDGVIRHRGVQLRRDELPAALDATRAEADQARAAFDAHDRQCRSLHLALARALGQGWEAYLKQLISLLHYLEHSKAGMEEHLQVLRRVYAVETAGRAKVGKEAVSRILDAAGIMYSSMDAIYTQASQVVVDATFAPYLEAESFAARLGKLELVPPSRENIGNWLNVVESWASHTLQAVAELAAATLTRLLETEAQVARWSRSEARDGYMAPAPQPVTTPASRDAYVSGGERLRAIRPDLWQRFLAAQGWAGGTLRLAVAGSIIGVVVLTGLSLGQRDIAIYNGLGREVRVDIGNVHATIPAYSSAQLAATPQSHYAVQARDQQGHVIEQFDADGGNGGTLFYNVAAAAPLVKWTATYGNVQPRPNDNLGNPRWGNADADVVFADPPYSISGKTGGLRTVLSGAGRIAPGELNGLVPPAALPALQQLHARWDDAHDVNLTTWLDSLQDSPQLQIILTQRLADNPGDMVAARMVQDMATPAVRTQLCAEALKRADATPDAADLRYLAIRCISDPAAKNLAFEQGARRWPDNGWFAFATGFTAAEQGNWPLATRLLNSAGQHEPALRDTVNVDLARLTRLQARDPGADVRALVTDSATLRAVIAVEQGRDMGDAPISAYHQLALGQVEQALARARGSEHEQRVLRLAAASTGAPRALVERVLAMPLDAQHPDATSTYVTAALAIRAGRDLVPYRASFAHLAQTMGSMTDPMYQFASALKAHRMDDATRALQGLPLALRGQAYAMGVIVLGPAAPADWRLGARCLLFAHERPYLV